MIEILKMVERNRRALQWSRQKMADEMAGGMTKEKLDTIMRNGKNGRLPRADTLQRMLNVTGLIGYEAHLFGWGSNMRDDDGD